MANKQVLENKQKTIDEITQNIKDSNSAVWFDYHGLTVGETIDLRKKLKDNDSYYKVYKNTLTKRALDSLKIDLGLTLEGPKAVAFGPDAIAPVKVLSDFAKKHPTLELKVGIVDGKIADIDTLTKLSQIPSREGLLTMFASGLMEQVRNFAVCLDLHSKNLEKEN